MSKMSECRTASTTVTEVDDNVASYRNKIALTIIYYVTRLQALR
jgi:hypothetical protein